MKIAPNTLATFLAMDDPCVQNQVFRFSGKANWTPCVLFETVSSQPVIPVVLDLTKVPIHKWADSSDPIVRESAEWALGELSSLEG